MRRLAAVVALAAATLLVPAGAARAHAVLESSTPERGARVESLEAITLTFSERPDPALSQLELVGVDGAAIPVGTPTPGERPEILTVPVDASLEPGTYLVSWRVFSSVDGHVTAGAFAFGYQADPEPVTITEPSEPGVTPLGVAGRALFLLGFALAFGAAIVELLSPLAVRALPMLAGGGAATGLLGVAILGHQQRVDSGASIAAFLSSPIGGAIGWRAGALVVAGIAALAWRRWMRSRRPLAIVVAIAAAAAATVHAINGHAAVGGSVQIVLHVVHLLAIGAWAGGFVPLLAAIRRGNPRRVVERFSRLALVAVALVILTGQLRAFDELPSIDAFWSTGYGRVAIAKWIVLLAILAFAAANRRRHVARVGDDPAPLQRSVRAEAVLSVVVVTLGALLANLAPRSAAAAGDVASGPVTVTRTSFAGDLEATLTVEPGAPGPARITLALRRLPEGAPVEDADVTLRLRPRARPGIEPLDVPLTAGEPGRFTGDTVLTPPGPFEATVLVQGATSSAEVVLPFATRTEQRTLDRGVAPTITDVTLDDGRVVQLYLDPEEPGQVEFHATFFDETGTELPVDEVHVVATGPDGIRPLVVRALTPGHVVADAFLGEGTWRFDVLGVATGDGRQLTAWVERTLAS